MYSYCSGKNSRIDSSGTDHGKGHAGRAAWWTVKLMQARMYFRLIAWLAKVENIEFADAVPVASAQEMNLFTARSIPDLFHVHFLISFCYFDDRLNFLNPFSIKPKRNLSAPRCGLRSFHVHEASRLNRTCQKLRISRLMDYVSAPPRQRTKHTCYAAITFGPRKNTQVLVHTSDSSIRQIFLL